MDLLEYKDKQGGERHPWETARFDIVMSLLKPYFKNNPPQNIADIGCGDTYVVNSFWQRHKSINYYAVDTAFSAEDIHYFDQQKGEAKITLLQNVEEIKAPKIDLILLMDVIEHIEDEGKFLIDLLDRKFVTKDTLFFISVPAYQSLFTAHDEHLLHFRRYNNKALKSKLKESGFEIIDTGYFFLSLLKVRILQKMLEKIIGKKEQKGLAEKNYSPKMANIVKSVLLLDFKIGRLFAAMHIKLPGLSTYAICRKSAS